MSNPLVTISVPTYNSEKTLKRCLDSIKNQTYKNIEINIIDASSKDQTISIAKKNGIKKIKICNNSLLASRYEGVKMAKGKYVLILDSDQILNYDSIEQAVKMAQSQKLDMLSLEEIPYSTKKFLEKLFDSDRKLINAVCDLDPFTGVILPRFFNTTLLKKAYAHIPKDIFETTGGPDHAIVYYESWLLSKRIGILKNAVKHIEPSSLPVFLKKFYRWGYTSIDAHSGKYHDLMTRKERFRTGLFTRGLIIESFGSIMLLVLKGVPFKIGFYAATFKKRFKT